MPRALLTGATCYVGQALARRLVDEGWEVHAVARPASDLSRLPGGVALHVFDGDLAAVVRAAAPEVVFHLAGLYRRDHEAADALPILQSNVIFGTLLLEAMRETGVRFLVNTGSYHQYLDGGAFRPVNLYAAAKEAFETLLAYYADAGLVRAVTLVLFDTYGPGDWRWRLMAAIREAASGGAPLPVPAEDLPIDMVHVEDVVAAYLRAADLLASTPEAVAGGRFAVSSGARVTISAIVAEFERLTGRPVPRRPGAWPAFGRKVTRLWEGPLLPGWQARVPLAEGVRRLMEER